MSIRAIDIGGTRIRRVDYLEDGARVKNFKEKKGVKSADQVVQFATAGLLPNTRGIAYSVAGVIEKNDLIRISPNAHYLDRVRLASITEEMSGVRASSVFNDMESAVMGMAALLPSLKYFMGITWGTGIGLRIFQNEKLLSVSEGGHMMIDTSPFAPLCGCGVRGHAEAILAGNGLIHRVLAETKARNISIPKKMHPCKFLDECYEKKQVWAVELYDVVSHGMGIFLANIQSLLCLPAIVWKGGTGTKMLKLLEKPIRKYMQKYMISPRWASEKNLKFIICPDPENDALIGAAKCLEKAL